MEEDDWGVDDEDDGWGDDAGAEAADEDDLWGQEDDFDAMEIDGDIPEIAEEEVAPKKEINFVVHGPKEIQSLLGGYVKQMAETLPDEDEELVKLILQHYKWKPAVAGDKYFGEMESARIISGVDADPVSAPPSDMTETDCDICLEAVDGNQLKWLGMNCGHRFCQECWISNLQESGKRHDCMSLRCPDENCQFAVTKKRLEAMGLQNVDSKKFKHFLKRVDKFTIDHFISCNKSYRFCPGVGCENIVECMNTMNLSIECTCGTAFCWSCSGPAHAPAPCKVYDAWVTKAAGRSEDDMKWIISNSKKCPGCGYWIERSQGCNHMTCRHPQCGHEFCWMCMAPWKTHGSSTGGYYKCNIYEAKKADAGIYDRERQAKLFQEELKKYNFYYERYHNQSRAAEKMKETMKSIEDKMDQLQDICGWKANEANFLRQAGQLVADNRRLLAWTFVIGFYADPELPRFPLFQSWQGDLESYTDRLHEMLEKPIETFAENSFRQDVVTYQRTIREYYTNLMKGLTKDFIPEAFPKGWKYVELTLDTA